MVENGPIADQKQENEISAKPVMVKHGVGRFKTNDE